MLNEEEGYILMGVFRMHEEEDRRSRLELQRAMKPVAYRGIAACLVRYSPHRLQEPYIGFSTVESAS
jgi:hypothetical protein